MVNKDKKFEEILENSNTLSEQKKKEISARLEQEKEIKNSNKDQSQELEKNEPEKNEVSVKMFQLAKSINRLLSGNQPQKKRNLDKLIKQTKTKKTNHYKGVFLCDKIKWRGVKDEKIYQKYKV